MTFHKIYREGVEVCSPELYLRWLTMQAYLQEPWPAGILSRDEMRDFRRLAERAFVRAYLTERRAGLPPRGEIDRTVVNTCLRAANDIILAASERREADRKRSWEEARELLNWRRQRGFAAIWGALGYLAATEKGRAIEGEED
jgi:hypothetical protein